MFQISKCVKTGHYQIACAQYFEATHNIRNPEDSASININHPNGYFLDSYKLLSGPKEGRLLMLDNFYSYFVQRINKKQIMETRKLSKRQQPDLKRRNSPQLQRAVPKLIVGDGRCSNQSIIGGCFYLRFLSKIKIQYYG